MRASMFSVDSCPSSHNSRRMEATGMLIRIGLTALLLAGCITCLALVTGHGSTDRQRQDGARPAKLLAQQGAGGAAVQ